MRTNVLPPVGRIKNIRMCTYTPDDYRKMSVLEISKKSDILSEHLGVSDLNHLCKTCSNPHSTCPGHYGHISLPIPVPNIAYMKSLLMVLNAICFNCHELRIPKTDPRSYRLLNESCLKKRANMLINMSGKGLNSKFNCHHCGESYIRFGQSGAKDFNIIAMVRIDSEELEMIRLGTFKPSFINMTMILNTLESITEDKYEYLCVSRYTRPESFLWGVIPVPPLNTRPNHTYHGAGKDNTRSFNQWNAYLSLIFTTTEKLRMLVSNNYKSKSEVTGEDPLNIVRYYYGISDKETFESYEELSNFMTVVKENIASSSKSSNKSPSKTNISKEYKKKKVRLTADDPYTEFMDSTFRTWLDLCSYIASFHWKNCKKYYVNSKFGNVPSNVENRYDGQRSGRWRLNSIGKRVDFAGRSVLEASILIRPDEIGVPIAMAMGLSIPEFVTEKNVDELTRYVVNGASVYPGAVSIEMRSGGNERLLKFVNDRRSIDMSEVRIVHRHLRNGDWVVVNRQPTLHRLSMLGLKVVITNEYVLRPHLCVFKGMGGDCDGDEVNIFVPQSIEASVEVRELFNMKNCVMKDQKVWACFIQHIVIGADIMSRSTTFIRPGVMAFLYSNIGKSYDHLPLTEKGYAGRDVISLILKSDYCFTSHSVTIVKGRITRGKLTDGNLNSSYGIIADMCRNPNISSDELNDFIHLGYILFQSYLDIIGHSASYSDSKINRELVSPNTLEKLDAAASAQARLIAYADSFVSHTPTRGDEMALENNLLANIFKLGQLKSDAAKAYYSEILVHDPANGIAQFVMSGAAGSVGMLSQMSNHVGQMFVNKSRISDPSSYYKKGSRTLQAGGLIINSYIDGLTPRDIVTQALPTAESVVTKAVATSDSGSFSRLLNHCLGGFVTNSFKNVVGTKGDVLWRKYGNDGYDPDRLISISVPEMDVPNAEIYQKYSEEMGIIHGKALQIMARATPGLMTELKCLCPIDLKQLMFTCESLFEKEPTNSISQRASNFSIDSWLSFLKDDTVDNIHVCFKFIFLHTLFPTNLRGYTDEMLDWLFKSMEKGLFNAVIQCGEAVGMNAAQSKSEVYTQMSLKTTHNAGKISKKQSGFNRICDIVYKATTKHGTKKVFRDPEMRVILKNHVKSDVEAERIALTMIETYTNQLMEKDFEYGVVDDNIVVVIPLSKKKCIEYMVAPRDIAYKTCHRMNSMVFRGGKGDYLDMDMFKASWVEDDEYKITITIPISHSFVEQRASVTKRQLKVPSVSMSIIAYEFGCNCVENVMVTGIPDVTDFMIEKKNVFTLDGQLESRFEITTTGSNLIKIMQYEDVDTYFTTSTSAMEVFDLIGREAAAKCIVEELLHLMTGLKDSRHLYLVAHLMTYSDQVKGLKNIRLFDHMEPSQKFTYNQIFSHTTQSCLYSEMDNIKTVEGAGFCNTRPATGTGFGIDLIMKKGYEFTPTVVPPFETSKYMVAPMVRGERILVLFYMFKNERVISCLNTLGQVFKLTSSSSIPEHIFAGSVIDGYYIANNNMFWITDLYMISGNVSTMIRYDQRMNISNVFQDMVLNGITFKCRPFFTLNYIDECPSENGLEFIHASHIAKPISYGNFSRLIWKRDRETITFRLVPIEMLSEKLLNEHISTPLRKLTRTYANQLPSFIERLRKFVYQPTHAICVHLVNKSICVFSTTILHEVPTNRTTVGTFIWKDNTFQFKQWSEDTIDSHNYTVTSFVNTITHVTNYISYEEIKQYTTKTTSWTTEVKPEKYVSNMEPAYNNKPNPTTMIPVWQPTVKEEEDSDDDDEDVEDDEEGEDDEESEEEEDEDVEDEEESEEDEDDGDDDDEEDEVNEEEEEEEEESLSELEE